MNSFDPFYRGQLISNLYDAANHFGGSYHPPAMPPAMDDGVFRIPTMPSLPSPIYGPINWPTPPTHMGAPPTDFMQHLAALARGFQRPNPVMPIFRQVMNSPFHQAVNSPWASQIVPTDPNTFLVR